jgi:hypothetical protein
MTADELNAIRYLTIGLAKETFKQDYESFGKEDDDYIREKLVLDSYCKGVEDVLKILENMKQEPIHDKPHIKGNYDDGFKNGLRTAKREYNKIRKAIKKLPITDTVIWSVDKIFDTYMEESESKR